ncbi:MAG: hypothetical protein IT245_09200 [Bacteroidia bacterium]|nr:hypothetical protein [Bacteroidia bacterium]
MKQSNQHIKSLEHVKFKVALRNDGIYHVFLKDKTVLDLELQSEMLAFYKEITNEEDGLFIFEAGHMCNVTKQARDKAIEIEAISPVSASVVFVQNMVYKMIANFFYRMNKPKQPYLVVTNFDEGIKWLKSLEPHQIKRHKALV